MKRSVSVFLTSMAVVSCSDTPPKAPAPKFPWETARQIKCDRPEDFGVSECHYPSNYHGGYHPHYYSPYIWNSYTPSSHAISPINHYQPTALTRPLTTYRSSVTIARTNALTVSRGGFGATGRAIGVSSGSS